MQQELENVVASGQYLPISLSEVARRCGCHNETLRRYNPVACDVIRARYQAYLHQEKDQRLQDIGNKFRSIGRQLRSQGIRFTQREVRKHFSQRRLFSRQKVRDLYQQVRFELEREISLV